MWGCKDFVIRSRPCLNDGKATRRRGFSALFRAIRPCVRKNLPCPAKTVPWVFCHGTNKARLIKEAVRLKRFLIFPCVLCLVIGLLVGVLLPIDLWGEDAPPLMSPTIPAPDPLPNAPEGSASASSSKNQEPLDTADNFPLLSSACAVTRAIQQRSWGTLAAYVHPDRGVTFTPYSTVDPDSDLTFTADQVKALAQDQNIYTWGFEDGRGDPIQMTVAQYFDRYVFDKDYTLVPEIGVDRIMTGGNALENLAEAYPGCRFVDFSFPSADPVNDGLDWSSLKLVFQAGGDRWYLVGVVHGEWTI